MDRSFRLGKVTDLGAALENSTSSGMGTAPRGGGQDIRVGDPGIC